MSRFILAAAIATGMLATPAAALEVSKSIEVSAPPATVWKTIGDFCGIGEWHPAVEKCALSQSGSKPQRSLSLKGGGTIVEQQEARDDAKTSYTYSILSSPLPVEDYRSTISVSPSSQGSKVTWSGSFKAKGADDAKAEDVIGGIYDAGLKGIAKQNKAWPLCQLDRRVLEAPGGRTG